MIGTAALGLAISGGLAHGAFHRNSPIFGAPITRVRGADAVALTFDDGPNPEATPRILDALATLDVRATFFVLGRHADQWPALVARMADEGHAVANHGWYHRKLHFKSPAYVRDDLERGTRSIEAAGGGRPALFRAPHGFRSPWVASIAKSLGQRTVGWSLGVWDSDRPGAGVIAERTVRGARAGAILLLHDGDGYAPQGDRLQTAESIPAVVAGVRAKGLRFVPLTGENW
ncbi:MAG: Polysaccharide deacetylase [Gemmatimonadetes bacterium]|nr:Polysaccharide deacetylase [Gemmatimonadota bacterium]